jgi:hypothetical protein
MRQPGRARRRGRALYGREGRKSACSGIAEPASVGAAGGNGEHDDAQRNHRQTHELEYQGVHSNLRKRKAENCREAVDRMLICNVGGGWLEGRVNDLPRPLPVAWIERSEIRDSRGKRRPGFRYAQSGLPDFRFSELALDFDRKSPAYSGHPVPRRGDVGHVTDVGTGCGGRVGVARRSTSMRTAKACGPDAPRVGVKFAMMLRITRTMVTRKPGRQGERV